jgi:DNA-binding NtrC family response regulator
MKTSGTVLIVEDEPNVRCVLAALLARAGHRTREAADGERALEALDAGGVDAVLTDLRMPRMNGLELLEAIRARRRRVPVILLTAHGTIGSAVEALKTGAFDYLTKPYDPEELLAVVDKAVRTHAREQRETLAEGDEDPWSLLVGSSRALAEVRDLARRVAPTAATVLISGESGTGKELVARGVHLLSPRAAGPFIKVNCAAIPQPLLESELFGYERGAFTGADRRKPGRFELADGGTLFLDEIGELPLSEQPKLLRALQDSRFYRVGGTETVQVDVRIVAATNRDLREAVASGAFREDLFYRLNVVPIALPALRDRPEDVIELCAHFLRRSAQRYKRAAIGIEPDALCALISHRWPGNIRELENAIERAVLLCDAPRLRVSDLPPEVLQPGDPEPVARGPRLRDRIRSATRRLERDAIEDALRATGGNVTQAAQRLGLSRRGLQLKMRELGIDGRGPDDPERDPRRDPQD